MTVSHYAQYRTQHTAQSTRHTTRAPEDEVVLGRLEVDEEAPVVAAADEHAARLDLWGVVVLFCVCVAGGRNTRMRVHSRSHTRAHQNTLIQHRVNIITRSSRRASHLVKDDLVDDVKAQEHAHAALLHELDRRRGDVEVQHALLDARVAPVADELHLHAVFLCVCRAEHVLVVSEKTAARPLGRGGGRPVARSTNQYCSLSLSLNHPLNSPKGEKVVRGQAAPGHGVGGGGAGVGVAPPCFASPFAPW